VPWEERPGQIFTKYLKSKRYSNLPTTRTTSETNLDLSVSNNYAPRHPPAPYRLGQSLHNARCNPRPQGLTSHVETDHAIWLDIRRPVQILYRVINNSLRIGAFWLHIRKDRAHCPLCADNIESLHHIFFYCTSPELTTIWCLAQRLWPPDFGPWKPPILGAILGGGSVAPRALGRARFQRILLPEFAHLIWVLRCARVTADKLHTQQSITTFWISKIAARLSLDHTLAKHPAAPHCGRRTDHTYL
jgi:hypothetical protein